MAPKNEFVIEANPKNPNSLPFQFIDIESVFFDVVTLKK